MLSFSTLVVSLAAHFLHKSLPITSLQTLEYAATAWAERVGNEP